MLEMPYLKGELNGIAIEYFIDGKIHGKIPYLNNKKEGLAQFFYPDGTIAKEVSFSKDKFSGISKNYHRDGTLMMEVFFRNGELIEGFTYQSGQKEMLSRIEIQKLKKLQHLLFYDNRSVEEQLLDNLTFE
jgi:antitoxin component YwqK of YwqJK toxin-antitoxin module